MNLYLVVTKETIDILGMSENKIDDSFPISHSFPLMSVLAYFLSFSTPGNIRKLFGFLMFSGGRKRMHWGQMG